MISLPTAGDTWGIPGPTFLAVFLAAAAGVVAGSALHRAWLFTRRPAPGDESLGPVEAAYLNGGDRLAVYTSLGWLRGGRAINVGPDRLLATTGPMPADSTALDQVVYDSVGKCLRVRDLQRDPSVAAALADLRRDLEGRRLVLGPAHRRAARLGPTLLCGLLAVGLLRFYAGLSNDQPIGYLVLSLIPLFVIFIWLARVPQRTGAGDAALKRLRARHAYLSPGTAYAMYGPTGAAMGVALFGAASLWALDPAFAAQAEIPRTYASTFTGGYSDGGGGGGGDGGGGGCGG